MGRSGALFMTALSRSLSLDITRQPGPACQRNAAGVQSFALNALRHSGEPSSPWQATSHFVTQADIPTAHGLPWPAVLAAATFALGTMALGYTHISLPPVVIVGGSSVGGFAIVFAFVGPVLYAVTALELFGRVRVAGFLACFIFIGPSVAEFTRFNEVAYLGYLRRATDDARDRLQAEGSRAGVRLARAPPGR